MRPSSPLTSYAVTNLVADLGLDPAIGSVEKARDLLLSAGATDVTARRDDGQVRVWSTFASAADAARAALDLVRLPTEPVSTTDVAASPRVALDTGEDPRSRSRLTSLLDRAAAGQILATTSAAVMAGPTLPRGAELYYRGRWRDPDGGPPQQWYQLRQQGGESDDPAPANLHWARRALAGPRPEPTAAMASALAAMRHGWRRVLADEFMMYVLTATTPEALVDVSAVLSLRLHAEGAQVLYGRWERQRPETLQALLEALGVYADRVPTATLRRGVEGRTGAISGLLPEVGVRLGLPPRSSHHVDDAEGFEAVEGWLAALAKAHPTLLVLHDLPPQDRDAARLFTHLRLACRRSRIMVLITTTEQPAAPSLDDLLATASGEDATVRHLRL